MKSRRWSLHVLGKYTLLQMPSLALVSALMIILHGYFDFPALYAWGVFLVWVVKDAVLYPFVWRAYDPHAQDGMEGLIGTTVEGLNPSGYIRVRGELWLAEVAEGLPSVGKGEKVEVERVRGLTLIVRPLASSAKEKV
jgi:membrane protein implicated in regulation of membrane protease activity